MEGVSKSDAARAAGGTVMAIPESRLETALRRIAESDEPHAELKADMLRAEHAAKKTKAAIFLMAEGTVAEREARSVASDRYNEAMEDYFNAVKDFNSLNNMRDLEFVVIDAFRTLEASRRAGNVT